jgi:pimeloyl-ACP methyl ester carboxylesterase
VSGGAHAGSYVSGLMSPTSPDDARARAQWIYAQGGPGIYDGDLVFYSEEFDGEVIGRDIDAARLPVALLTGNYDYSASPADTRAVAQAIPGSYFREMTGLGHFPMTEHYAAFKPHFAAALAFVRERLPVD